jgi:hypothetical protein
VKTEAHICDRCAQPRRRPASFTVSASTERGVPVSTAEVCRAHRDREITTALAKPGVDRVIVAKIATGGPKAMREPVRA